MNLIYVYEGFAFQSFWKWFSFKNSKYLTRVNVTYSPEKNSWKKFLKQIGVKFKSQLSSSCIEINPNIKTLLSELTSHLYTLYNVILRIASNLLETRENIKISTHPFYPINLDRFSWGWFFIFFFLFFASSPWKSVKVSWAARMGQNFDDYPGF